MLWRQLHLTFLHFSARDRVKLRDKVVVHKGGKLSISSLKYQKVHTPHDNSTDRKIHPSNKNFFWELRIIFHPSDLYLPATFIIPAVNENLPTDTSHLLCHDGGTVFVLSMRMFLFCLPACHMFPISALNQVKLILSLHARFCLWDHTSSTRSITIQTQKRRVLNKLLLRHWAERRLWREKWDSAYRV